MKTSRPVSPGSRPGLAALALVLSAAAARADGGDPLVQEAKLLEQPIDCLSEFGWDVDLDGDTLVVSDITEGGPTNQEGRIYVYRRVGTGWVETDQLGASDPASADFFGSALALDGNRLVTTAWDPGQQRDEFYVLERNGTTWTEVAILTAPEQVVGQITMDVDGVTVVAGEYQSSLPFVPGEVFVFERTGPSWGQVAKTKITSSNPQDLAYFGYSLAIEGDMLAVGAPFEDIGGVSSAGRTYVFTRSAPGVWSETAVLAEVGGPMTSAFGSAVALDGNVLAVGAQSSGTGGTVTTYLRSGTAWTPDQVLLPDPGTGTAGFGFALDLLDGRMLVGAPFEGVAGSRGAAYLFSLEAGTWTRRQREIPADAVGGMWFGDGVALGDGSAAVAAPQDHPVGQGSCKHGSVYAYGIQAAPPTAYCTAKPTSGGCLPAVGWNGSAELTGPDDFLVVCRDVPPQKNGLFFYGLTGPAALPWLGGTLCVQPPLTRTPPQSATGTPPCNGGYTFAFPQALMTQLGLSPCDTLHGQWWMRDPTHPDGTGVALSDGVRIEIGI